MDYTLSVWAIATFIEANIKEEIAHQDLEKISGFTYRHIRTIMKEKTGLSLANYILSRRIANAAFDLVHTTKPITSIAFEYNFASYDSFARAFKRVTSKSPKHFREGSHHVGHRRILMGFYAPEIYKDTDITYTHPVILEDLTMKKKIDKNQNSCILFGVPKVTYSYEECTPLAVSLKSALSYLGDVVDYTHIINAMGASFRLRWNKDYWDGGNVDVLNIYENQYDVLDYAFQACNRNYTLYPRSTSSKEEFKRIIIEQIDKGNPVIALGIIGPPEAGVITGYQDNGDTLLGWNVFQENKEMAGNVKYHDCGYYITDGWWENPDTFAIITIEDEQDYHITNKDILVNGLKIMEATSIEVRNETGKVRDRFACGKEAFTLWRDGITDESLFNQDSIIPLKIEKLMCQGDAQMMIGEGRSYVRIFLERLAKENSSVADLCNKAAREMKQVVDASNEMFRIRGGVHQSKEVLDNFMKPEIRQRTAALIDQALKHELNAIKLIKEIIEKM